MSNWERGVTEGVTIEQILNFKKWQCVWARCRQDTWRNEIATENFHRRIFNSVRSWMNCSGKWSCRGRQGRTEGSLLRAVAVRAVGVVMESTSRLKLRKREEINTLRRSTWDKGKDKSRDSVKKRDKDKNRNREKGNVWIATMTSGTRSEASNRPNSWLKNWNRLRQTCVETAKLQFDCITMISY